MVTKLFRTLAAICGLMLLFAALPVLTLGKSIGWSDVFWYFVIATGVVLIYELYVYLRYRG
ncbi:hypothetical protein KC953_02470 [Candidatus Saccharibacteria bacterium]|nr:hypothetical protein [Candidatus Saccharibacteria bacterium]